MKHFTILIVLCIGLPACRSHHLGDSTGKYYRVAFDNQIASDAEVEGLSAAEAQAVMLRNSQLGGASIRTKNASSADSGPALPAGSTGRIELNAK